MYHYSATSKDRLEECHEDIQKIFAAIMDYVDCTIVCGHRGMEEQNRAYVAGNSTLQYPDSKHNKMPSMAVDAAPYFKDTGIDWEDEIAFAYFAGRIKQIADQLYNDGTVMYRLRWGGDWDNDGRNADQRFNDLVHFELADG